MTIVPQSEYEEHLTLRQTFTMVPYPPGSQPSALSPQRCQRAGTQHAPRITMYVSRTKLLSMFQRVKVWVE